MNKQDNNQMNRYQIKFYGTATEVQDIEKDPERPVIAIFTDGDREKRNEHAKLFVAALATIEGK